MNVHSTKYYVRSQLCVHWATQSGLMILLWGTHYDLNLHVMLQLDIMSVGADGYDIRVPARHLERFKSILDRLDMDYRVLVEDVQA